MKNISISTFIHIIFTISFLALISFFALFVNLDKKQFETNQKNRYELIANGFLSGFKFFPTKKQLQEQFQKFQVSPVDQRDFKLEILNNAKLVYQKESFPSRVRIFLYNNRHYVYVQEIGYNLMLKDLKPKSYNLEIAIAVFALLILIFFFLYISILKKLSPLKKLNNQIKEFSNGNLNVQIIYDGSDEIAQIASSFDEAIKNINQLISSKNLFMRNMMHELKTPIAKAMISTEMLPPSQDKEILLRAFERMNEIISELAKIEKFSAKELTLKKQKITIQEIYNDTLDLLMIDSANIKTNFKDVDLFVDKTLFEISIKNLIDNALKFNQKEKVEIKADKYSIEIISYGNELTKPLEFYAEPFSQEEKRQSGLGLGLYIVKTILDLHNMKLTYKYKDGKNYFTILL